MVDTDHIQLAHGGGGQLTAELIEQVILPILGGQDAAALKDAAVLERFAGRPAFTTDSYVVQPLEFPGGDIGRLAVCGTVNDLAVVGATPRAISLGLVLEEGLEIALLRRVLGSIAQAAGEAGVAVVTGDTKVVQRGGVEGMILNTSGLGEVMPEANLGFDRVRTGDRIVLSGPVGEHGLAIMSRRRGLSFTADLRSDCAPLNALTAALVGRLREAVRFMRDPTRGGLAATLVDLARGCGRDVEVDEASIPVNRTARAVAEMLGLDLMTVANEGKLVAVVAPETSQEARAVLADSPIGRRAAVIGVVGPATACPLVEMVTSIGGRRVVQMPYGEELPRIC
jgi:hydrogenase expression/formation protein HypE